MSSKELSWALEAEVDHPMKRWLLVCIAELLYPNTSDLIELSKMKRSTVYEILGKLGKDNLVIKTEHNRYLLNTDSVHVMDGTTYEQFRELDSEVCAETEEKEGELVREPDLEDNTIINTNGRLTAHNTDSFAAQVYLTNYDNRKKLYIIGDGGYGKAVKWGVVKNNFDYEVVSRDNWDELFDIKDSIVYNCTPVDITDWVDTSNDFINCLVNTETGKELAKLQASEQFYLYTGLEFPL